ncbi:MAG: AraC family transcriptional regulator [Clostridia bacterium]|nr:AraC family transcriptional regulator [Clostridia bacterium]
MRKIQNNGTPGIYHYHENIELIYCDNGELCVTMPSETIVLQPGDFIYLAPNTPHSTDAKSDTNEHIFVKFLPSFLHVTASRKIPPVNYFISLTPKCFVFKSNPENKDEIRNLFFDCYRNFSHTDYFKRLIFRSSVMRLMAYVFENSISNINEERSKTIPAVLLAVLDYIDNNYATVTLEEAADFCSLSYSYFSRTFKSTFNIPFSNYVIKKRVEKSLNLIANSNLSLNDIALECGFANLSHFIKCFTNEKSITPRQFRSIVTPK